MPELKAISKEAVAAALEKAERYRLLNEPRESESICRDALRTSPGHQHALITLLLSLTDQFGKGFGVDLRDAREILPQIQGDYEQAYYSGVVLERWGKSRPEGGAPVDVMHDWLRQAMAYFQQAEEIRPAGNDEAILRWNTCARIIGRRSGGERPTHHPEGPDGPESFDDEVPIL